MYRETHHGIHEYFVLINYKTKEKFLCSWAEEEPLYFNQKVYFAGNGIDGLGGYRQMLKKGFVDRRFQKPAPFSNKLIDHILSNLPFKVIKK